MSWYYAREGRQVGPVDEAELRSQIAAGVVRADTLVWREGMAGWLPYVDVAGGARDASAGLQNCTQCGRAFAEEEMIRFGDRWVCAACKPVFVQGLKEGTVATTRFRYGGFWIRFGARVIDMVILWMVGVVLQIPITMKMVQSAGEPASMRLLGLQMLVYALQFAIGITYETVFVGKYGATPGKMACGLRVVTPDGGRITYARALARYFSTIISSLTLLIGYIMAAFDEEKRALHDRICDTRVVRA